MRRYHRVSELSEEHREELMRWAQSRTLPAGDVFRARLMLALAEGKNWNQIEVELHIPRGRPFARWTRRFEREGMAGLDPGHQHAAVFCVDEKSAIQALDRLDAVLPMSQVRAERHGFESIATERFRCMRLWR